MKGRGSWESDERIKYFLRNCVWKYVFEIIKQVWNLMDTGLIKYGMSLAFPSIKYNKKIFIDPVASRITLESVLNEYS